MEKKPFFTSARLEVLLAFLIALVTLTTAIFVWRTNSLGSTAGDLVHSGLIDVVKVQASSNEDWRKVYEEASYARDYSIYLSGVEAMEASGDANLISQAKNLRQYLLPGLQVISSPLGTEAKYLLPNGTYDLQKRYADLEAENTELSKLNPKHTIDLANVYFSQQRWESIGLILLAISLFWLSLAEISRKWMRPASITIGTGLFLLGITWELVFEAIFAISRSSLL